MKVETQTQSETRSETTSLLQSIIGRTCLSDAHADDKDR